MVTEAKVEQATQEIADLMKANGVVKVENTISWKTYEEVPPQIAFDGNESEGLRVLDLIRVFAEERQLIVTALRREWTYLEQESPDPPRWIVEFIKPELY